MKFPHKEIRLNFRILHSLPHFHTHISKSQEGHVKYVKWVAVFNSSTKENLSLFVLTILFALKSISEVKKTLKKDVKWRM